MELLTVIALISILAAMLMAAAGSIRSRVEKVKCMSNLRNLHVAANHHVQERGQWPQISSKLLVDRPEEYAQQWITALKPWKITPAGWICPTIQQSIGFPDISKEENARVDYIANPFDNKPFSPFKWPTQPWFVERGDVHGNGNLIIFTDGSIRALGDIVLKDEK